MIYPESSTFTIRIVIATALLFFLFKKVFLHKESNCRGYYNINNNILYH